MSEGKQRYLSFLLRLWPVKENEHSVWRASLESPHTGERWGFADVEALCTFLHEQIAASADAETGKGGMENR
ncbi:MAG: hypothetical protein JXR84_23010 [Anaerolineae bacterium]|nr:hypothetical protein [Anaerolineae bacterium]